MFKRNSKSKKAWADPERDGIFIEPTDDDGGFAAINTVMYGEEQDVDDL